MVGALFDRVGALAEGGTGILAAHACATSPLASCMNSTRPLEYVLIKYHQRGTHRAGLDTRALGYVEDVFLGITQY